jgi:hypothetical protein
MEINYVAVGVATVLQFLLGWIWYMPIFGKAWGEIHGFDEKSPEEQARMQKEMMPLMVTQLIITIITSFVFAVLQAGFPANWNIFGLAGFFWIGFVVPTQIAAVIFGGTPKHFMVKKSAIMAGASFFCFQILAAVFHFMG